MRISDWSSDVCSSDLLGGQRIDQQRRDRDGQTDAERPPRFTLVFENLASVLERAEQRRHALIICRALCRQRERSGGTMEYFGLQLPLEPIDDLRNGRRCRPAVSGSGAERAGLDIANKREDAARAIDQYETSS